MRLICPECGAQYEVPDAVIPPQGRDVQCSACNTTWFAVPEGPVADPEPVAGVGRGAVAPASAETTVDATPEAEPDGPPPPPRRQIDPGVLNVLREEAEFEAKARAAERPPLAPKTSPEADKDPPEEPAAPAPDPATATTSPKAEGAGIGGRDVRTADDAPDDAPQEPDPPQQLPDPKALQATLDKATARPAPSGREAAATPARSGSTRGLLLVAAIAALALLGYVFAENLATEMPGLAPSLEQYVAAVDALRAWLDTQVLRGLAWINDVGAPEAGAAQTGS